MQNPEERRPKERIWFIYIIQLNFHSILLMFGVRRGEILHFQSLNHVITLKYIFEWHNNFTL